MKPRPSFHQGHKIWFIICFRGQWAGSRMLCRLVSPCQGLGAALRPATSRQLVRGSGWKQRIVFKSVPWMTTSLNTSNYFMMTSLMTSGHWPLMFSPLPRFNSPMTTNDQPSQPGTISLDDYPWPLNLDTVTRADICLVWIYDQCWLVPWQLMTISWQEPQGH